MTPETMSFVLIFIITGTGMALLAIFVWWQHQKAPGAAALSLIMLAVAVWSLGDAFELGGADLQSRIFWTKIRYFGIVVLPAAWFVLAMQYSGRERWMKKRHLALLAIEPVAMLLLVWTNEFHHLVWVDWRLEPAGSIIALFSTHGVGFYFNLVYSYALALLATIIIIDAIVRLSHLYRKQAGAMLIAALAPWAGNILYLSGLNPIRYPDLTSFGFVVTCLACAWGLFRFRLLDIRPVARDAVIQSLSDAVIVLDMDDRIVDVNPATRQILGLASSPAIGEPIEEALADCPVLVKTLKTKTETRMEIELGRDGDMCQFDLCVSPLHENGNTQVGYLVTLHDITERKAIERALDEHRQHLEEQVRERTSELKTMNEQLQNEVAERERTGLALQVSEERYRTLVEGSRDIIFSMDLKTGLISSVNNYAEEMLGYKREEIVGTMHFLDLVRPKERENALNSLRERLEENVEHTNAPFRLRKADNSYIDVEVNGAVISDADGKPSSYLGVIRNVTERKRTEDAVRESEEKYRRLFEESKDGIFISTPEGKFLDINSAAIELYGYSSRDEILKADIMRDLYGDPSRWELIKNIIDEKGFVRDYEQIHRKKDGSEIIVTETVSPVRDDSGALVAYRGIVRDVTEHRQLQQQLLQAQKMESIGTLAGGVAHDFNNLLTAILGHTQMAMSELPNSGQAHDDLREVEAAANRAAALTQQLLAFSRKQVIRPRLMDVNVTLRDTKKMLKRLIRENIDLQVTPAAGLWRIMADPTQIEQIVMNLVINARDAMNDDGSIVVETKNVTLDEDNLRERTEMEPGRYVMMTVADTGAGIAKEVVDHIFDPFFTTKPTGMGTGLGLSTAYGIVKQHNGHIFVHSEEGQGATFEIYLPAADIEEEAEHSAPGEAASPPGGTETILVVEDEAAVRRMAMRILSELGYTVWEASNGKEALALLEERGERPDLLLSDLVMPEMGGKDLADEYERRFSGAKILFISGYTSGMLQSGEMTDHETELLLKPFTFTGLAQKVREVLDKPGGA